MLNLTVLDAGVELKFVPVIVIIVPCIAELGLNEVIVGAGVVSLSLEQEISHEAARKNEIATMSATISSLKFEMMDSFLFI